MSQKYVNWANGQGLAQGVEMEGENMTPLKENCHQGSRNLEDVSKLLIRPYTQTAMGHSKL